MITILRLNFKQRTSKIRHLRMSYFWDLIEKQTYHANLQQTNHTPLLNYPSNIHRDKYETKIQEYNEPSKYKGKSATTATTTHSTDLQATHVADRVQHHQQPASSSKSHYSPPNVRRENGLF